jgi:hypothetical protein
MRTFDAPFLVVDRFAIEKGLHEADAALGAGGSVPQVLSHRGELRLSVTRASLDDERCRRDCRQRSDLFRHQHRMPQRDQEQAADGPLVPHPKDPADQGRVLQVGVRSQECRSPTVRLSSPARTAASAWARTDLGARAESAGSNVVPMDIPTLMPGLLHSAESQWHIRHGVLRGCSLSLLGSCLSAGERSR